MSLYPGPGRALDAQVIRLASRAAAVKQQSVVFLDQYEAYVASAGTIIQSQADRISDLETCTQQKSQHIREQEAEREEIAQRLARSEERLERAVRREERLERALRQAEAQSLATAHDQQWEADRQQIRKQEEEIAGLQTIMRDQSARITELQEMVCRLRLAEEQAQAQRLISEGLLEQLHSCQQLLQETDNLVETTKEANTHLRTANQDCYTDRNQLVQLCAHLANLCHYRAGWATDHKVPDWPVILIELPTGQLSYHIPKAEQLSPLAVTGLVWDDHTTDEKRRRLQMYLQPQRVSAESLPPDCIAWTDALMRHHVECPSQNLHVVAENREQGIEQLRKLLA